MSNDKDLMGYDPLEWLKEDSAEDATPAEPEQPAEALHETAETVSEEASAEPQADEPAAIEPVPAETPGEEVRETVNTTAGDAVLDLQNSLQIMDVALLKPRLEQSLSSSKEITLCADDDIAVDGAGMQLLLAFVKQAKSSGVELKWQALPAPIAEAARLLNAEQVLLTGNY